MAAKDLPKRQAVICNGYDKVRLEMRSSNWDDGKTGDVGKAKQPEGKELSLLGCCATREIDGWFAQ